MKKMNVKNLVLAGCAGFAGLAATVGLAQQIELPTFLKGENLVYQGRVSDMDVYVMEGYPGLWLVAPDGMSAIAGTIFSSIGHDIGATYTGGKPIRAFEIKPESVLTPETTLIPDKQNPNSVIESTRGTKPGFTPVNPDFSQAPVVSESELSRTTIPPQTTQATEVISSIFTDQEIMKIAGIVNGVDQDISDTLQTGNVDETSSGNVNETLSSNVNTLTQQLDESLDNVLSIEDKEALMQTLGEMISNGVETEDQLMSVVSNWTDIVTRKYNEKISGSNTGSVNPGNSVDSLDLVDSVDPVDPIEGIRDFVENSPLFAEDSVKTSAETPVETSTETSAQRAPSGSLTQVGITGETGTEPSLADQLLDEIRYNGFWFGVGYPDIPVVYAFMDPACPYCAKSIINIMNEMEQSKFQLRVLLVPVVSSGSRDLIAAIMTDELDPPVAFMEHEYAHAHGRSYFNQPDKPESKKWDQLPDLLQTEVLDNVNIMSKYEITSVHVLCF